MSTTTARRRKHRTRPLDEELALLAEHLRLSRNGGFTLLSYDAPEQCNQWLAALHNRLGDVLFYRVPLPSDGIGVAQRIEQAATRSELAMYPLSVMVIGNAESLDEAAQTNLVANLNRMRGHLARVAYPLLFCVDSATLRMFSQQAPDLFDRIGLWSDMRGFEPPVEAPAPPLDPETQYRETLARKLRLVEFRGILSINKPVTLPLRDFYVPLEAEQRIEQTTHGELLYSSTDLEERERLVYGEQEDDGRTGRTSRASQNPGALIDLKTGNIYRKERVVETRPLAVADAVRDNRTLVVLGDPGAGKSTLLRAIALAAAEDQSERVGLEPHQNGWLPILVSCAAYSAALERTPALRLIHFIADTLAEQFDVTNALTMLRAALLRRRVLLLFDGLDEVQSKHRAKIASAVNAFIDAWCNAILNGNRAVVSSRIIGYGATQIQSAQATVTLRDFAQPQIEQFLHTWCVAYEQFARGDVPEARADGEKQAAQLAAEISGNAGARRLAGNPLLLTIMALIQRQGVKMPERRVELYDIASRTLIETWNRARGLSETILLNLPDTRLTFALLGDLALWMQEQSLTAATTDVLLPVLTEAQRRRGVSQPDAAAAFLHDVQQYSGLLAERGPDTYSFLHLTFQEYFAARALATNYDKDQRWRKIAPHLHDPRWRETILLTAGELGVRIGREDEVTDLVQRILAATPPPSKLTQALFERRWLWWTLRDAQLDQIEEHYLKRHVLLAGQILADDPGVSTDVGQRVTGALLHLSWNRIIPLQNAASALLKRAPVAFRAQAAATPFRQLSDQDTDVRRNATYALGQLGSASPAVVDALLAALSDQTTNVRYSAAAALTKLQVANRTIRLCLLEGLTNRSFKDESYTLLTSDKQQEADTGAAPAQ